MVVVELSIIIVRSYETFQPHQLWPAAKQPNTELLFLLFLFWLWNIRKYSAHSTYKRLSLVKCLGITFNNHRPHSPHSPLLTRTSRLPSRTFLHQIMKTRLLVARLAKLEFLKLMTTYNILFVPPTICDDNLQLTSQGLAEVCRDYSRLSIWLFSMRRLAQLSLAWTNIYLDLNLNRGERGERRGEERSLQPRYKDLKWRPEGDLSRKAALSVETLNKHSLGKYYWYHPTSRKGGNICLIIYWAFSVTLCVTGMACQVPA